MNKYIYSINNNVLLNELCLFEMERLFNVTDFENYIFSDLNYAANKSYFFKEKMNILFMENSFEKLMETLLINTNYKKTFKVTYMKNENDDLEYDDYIKKIIETANNINGEGELKNPDIILAITNIENNWYFGEYEKNDYAWRINNKKPFSYSNALSCDISRSIINIASTYGNTIIDPCCGVGTVVIDGLLQKANIEGVEINDAIGLKAQKNLGYLELDQVIEIKDMHDIEKNYDVSILDIPYGIMSHTDDALQLSLIKNCYNISELLILVSCEDMRDKILEANFKIEKMLQIRKHNNSDFSRYITICKKF